MIEPTRAKLPKKFGFRIRIFHHREHREHREKWGGLGVSPLEPRGFSFGVLGEHPPARAFSFSVSSVPLW
jgi:hypothetical protein